MYICNCSYTSKLKAVFFFGLILSLCCACSRAGARRVSSYDHYWVKAADERVEADRKWADYLFNHLDRRTGSRSVALRQKSAQGTFLQIVVHVDAKGKHDYSTVLDGDVLRLIACDEDKMLWLIYQFLASGEDPRIEASDLPPAMIDIAHAEGDFAFEYRGIYSPSNADPELMPVTASHHVDYDWGLWGHNLRRVFPGGVPEEALAWVDGQRDENQFCFSSELLFKAVEAYVTDNYGETGGVRFAIMPNDNGAVCACKACTAAGNTRKVATPSVSRFIRRLAARFPHHLFFTSSYRTTEVPPAEPLPQNAGVIISAMDLPLQPDFAGKRPAENFSRKVKEWRKVVSRIYVWDYMRNFDDYFTPYPCLGVLSERLRYFYSLGVKGLFYNGSGYDYASFDDLQTAALACMLINPDLPLESYTERYLKRFYPHASDILLPAYLSWERIVKEREALLPFYGGIADAVSAWLDPVEFGAFCDRLDGCAKRTDGMERRRLNELLTALQFTRLELLRMPAGAYDERKADLYLESLYGYTAFSGMKNYREAFGSVQSYLEEWNILKTENRESQNPLKGIRLSCQPAEDENAASLPVLTDGLYALPSDYHTGWFIASSRRFVLQVPPGKISDGAVLELSLLYAPAWHIFLPASVEVWQGEGKMASFGLPPVGEKEVFSKQRVSCKLETVNPDIPVELRFMQVAAARASVACDEIKVY